MPRRSSAPTTPPRATTTSAREMAAVVVGSSVVKRRFQQGVWNRDFRVPDTLLKPSLNRPRSGLVFTWVRGRRLQAPGLALGAVEPAGGFGVAEDFLALGVPAQRPVEPVGDVAQV